MEELQRPTLVVPQAPVREGTTPRAPEWRRHFFEVVRAVAIGAAVLAGLALAPYPWPLHVTGVITAEDVVLVLRGKLAVDPEIDWQPGVFVIQGADDVDGLSRSTPAGGDIVLNARQFRLTSITAADGATLALSAEQPGRLRLSVQLGSGSFQFAGNSSVRGGSAPDVKTAGQSAILRVSSSGASGSPLTVDIPWPKRLVLKGFNASNIGFAEGQGATASAQVVSSVTGGWVTLVDTNDKTELQPGEIARTESLNAGAIRLETKDLGLQVSFSGTATSLEVGTAAHPIQVRPSILRWAFEKPYVKTLSLLLPLAATLLVGWWQVRQRPP